ncbi:Bgt-50838 [Blumeria graminis f. sp. tritici]|uniref:Bgt-50838 n=1 Tax=Blumeria graminis f. sp. tritici TaxID=62690 RepID=A0A9X9QF55_BLUGR|nr:Bgt-50838 [Blumeria graminis f. sp. tritici]
MSNLHCGILLAKKIMSD